MRVSVICELYAHAVETLVVETVARTSSAAVAAEELLSCRSQKHRALLMAPFSACTIERCGEDETLAGTISGTLIASGSKYLLG